MCMSAITRITAAVAFQIGALVLMSFRYRIVLRSTHAEMIGISIGD